MYCTLDYRYIPKRVKQPQEIPSTLKGKIKIRPKKVNTPTENKKQTIEKTFNIQKPNFNTSATPDNKYLNLQRAKTPEAIITKNKYISIKKIHSDITVTDTLNHQY